MSKVWSTPVSEAYPVNFRSGGDTTRDAFGKHIQEIKRIYGCLNALDSGKVSANDVNGSIGNINTALQKHIDSTNPHPNYKPSLSFSDISGTLDASKVVGKLTNATIDASRVNGLTSQIDSRIPATGDGITSSVIDGNGWVKFKNDLIIQWGRVRITPDEYNAAPEAAHAVTFSKAFSDSCFIVTAGTEADVDDGATGALDNMIQVKDISKTGFKYMVQDFYKGAYRQWKYLYCSYIAIGK